MFQKRGYNASIVLPYRHFPCCLWISTCSIVGGPICSIDGWGFNEESWIAWITVSASPSNNVLSHFSFAFLASAINRSLHSVNSIQINFTSALWSLPTKTRLALYFPIVTCIKILLYILGRRGSSDATIFTFLGFVFPCFLVVPINTYNLLHNFFRVRHFLWFDHINCSC